MKKFLLGVVGACAIAAGVMAATWEPTQRSDDITDVLTRADINEINAESAPQQQVVNGWAAKDLLEIQARQFEEFAAAQRRLLLVVALVGGAAAVGLIAVGLGQRQATANPAPASPNSVTAPLQPDPSGS